MEEELVKKQQQIVHVGIELEDMKNISEKLKHEGSKMIHQIEVFVCDC